MVLRNQQKEAEGAGATVAEIKVPDLSPTREVGAVLTDVQGCLRQLADFANDQKRAGRGDDPEVKGTILDELKRLGPLVEAHSKALAAMTARYGDGGATEDVYLQRAAMRMKVDDDPDLPKGMDNRYFNLVTLRADELVGISKVGFRRDHDRIVEGFTGNKRLATSAGAIERFQYLNDRLIMKDEIFSILRKQQYLGRGTRLDRMRQMSEWPEYERIGDQLLRALGEDSSGTAKYLVPVVLSSQVGEMVEAQAVVMALFPSITMTSKTFEWPFQRTRATAQHVADNDPVDDDPSANNITASQMTFGKPIWTAQRIADLSFIAHDVEDDSIESAIDQQLLDLSTVLSQAKEKGGLCGEYKAATMDGTGFNPAGGDQRWCNGLRFHALMTSSYAASIAAGASLSFTHGVQLLQKMKAWGAGAAVTDTVWICDYVAWGNLFLVNSGDARYFQTTDGVPAGRSSLFTGQVGTFLGRPVVLSPFLPQTHTDGKVSATPGNNIKGTLLCVNRQRYVIGDRRAIYLDTSEHVAFRKFQTALRGSMRLDFESKDSDGTKALVAGSTPVGIIYSLN